MPVYQTTQRWVTNPDGSKTRGTISEPAEAAVEPVAVAESEAEPEVTTYSTPRTHAEADEQAAALGVEFPDDVATVKEKAAFLASYS